MLHTTRMNSHRSTSHPDTDALFSRTHYNTITFLPHAGGHPSMANPWSQKMFSNVSNDKDAMLKALIGTYVNISNYK